MILQHSYLISDLPESFGFGMKSPLKLLDAGTPNITAQSPITNLLLIIDIKDLVYQFPVNPANDHHFVLFTTIAASNFTLFAETTHGWKSINNHFKIPASPTSPNTYKCVYVSPQDLKGLLFMCNFIIDI